MERALVRQSGARGDGRDAFVAQLLVFKAAFRAAPVTAPALPPPAGTWRQTADGAATHKTRNFGDTAMRGAPCAKLMCA
jgi:hypothetical protein